MKIEISMQYVDFLKKTCGVSLTELIEGAGLESPFVENALKKVISAKRSDMLEVNLAAMRLGRDN